jgi:hypothetical protein
MSAATCPDCHGRGRSVALLHIAGRGCVQHILRCDTCAGAGVVSAAQQARFEAASRLRQARLRRRLRQTEVARACGLTAAAYNDHEWGRGAATVPQIEALLTVVQRWRPPARRGEDAW